MDLFQVTPSGVHLSANWVKSEETKNSNHQQNTNRNPNGDPNTDSNSDNASPSTSLAVSAQSLPCLHIPAAGDFYDSDEPPELELDLGRLMECASEALHARCTAARKLSRGDPTSRWGVGRRLSRDLGGDGR